MTISNSWSFTGNTTSKLRTDEVSPETHYCRFLRIKCRKTVPSPLVNTKALMKQKSNEKEKRLFPLFHADCDNVFQLFVFSFLQLERARCCETKEHIRTFRLHYGWRKSGRQLATWVSCLPCPSSYSLPFFLSLVSAFSSMKWLAGGGGQVLDYSRLGSELIKLHARLLHALTMQLLLFSDV